MEPRTITVGARTLTVFEGGGESAGEPRVRDLDLALWLEYGDPHKIRPLIRRHVREGNVSPREVFPTVGKNTDGVSATVAENQKRGRGRPGRCFYLTEADALFIAAKSETPKANELLRGIIATFIEARRVLATSAPSPARDGRDWHPFLMRLAPAMLAELTLLGEESQRRPEDVAWWLLHGALSTAHATRSVDWSERVTRRARLIEAQGVRPVRNW